MGSRALLNLLLLALVVGLGLLVWLEPGREPPPEAPALTALNIAQVQRIRIQRPEDTVVFVRDGDHWRLDEPLAAPAADFRVRAILDLAKAKSRDRFPAEEGKLVQYGLAEPELQLFFDALRFDVGGTEPIERRRYVRVGDTVHLIDDRYSSHLHAPTAELVSRLLLPPDSEPVGIELPEVAVARTEDGNWTVTPQPEHYSADSAPMLADAWQSARARDVGRIDPGQGEQDAPRVKVHLAGRQEPLVFTIVQREPELVLGRPDLGLRYRFSKVEAAQLLELPEPEPAEEAAPEPSAPEDKSKGESE